MLHFIVFLAQHVNIPENKVQSGGDMSHSRSDQTGIKQSILQAEPPKNIVKASAKEQFFQFNAKPSAKEAPVTNSNIPEHIVTTKAKENKSDLHSDVLTLYLEKEKYENKFRPKVSNFL